MRDMRGQRVKSTEGIPKKRRMDEEGKERRGKTRKEGWVGGGGVRERRGKRRRGQMRTQERKDEEPASASASMPQAAGTERDGHPYPRKSTDSDDIMGT